MVGNFKVAGNRVKMAIAYHPYATPEMQARIRRFNDPEAIANIRREPMRVVNGG
jgi:hypothetical protein